MRRNCFLGFLVLAVAAAAIVVPQPAGATGTGWQILPAERTSGQDFIFSAVTAPAQGEVWAIGYHWETVGGALEFRTLAEHLKDGQFVVVPTPDRETAPAVDLLWGASGTAANDVWAVGTSLPAGVPSSTLILHWDASAWTIVSSPNPGVHGNDLQAVAARTSSDAWAVGARTDDFYQTPMALHWNGTLWAETPVPNPTGCSGHSYLAGVTVASAKRAWAVGYCQNGGTGTGSQGYIVMWNGRAWTVAAAGGVVPGYSQLLAVSSVGLSDVWAVGSTTSGATTASLTMHWDGTAWTAVANPSKAGLEGVVVTGGKAWAVGAGDSPQPPFAGPSSMRWNGTAWRRVLTPPDFGRLSGVAVDPDGVVWAAGSSLGDPLVERYG